LAKVDDVAAALLERTGPIDTWRFQKLMYYCQAWHLVWDGHRLFPSRIEAWANGPVVRDLYPNHRGKYELSGWQWGHPEKLSPSELGTISAVVRDYGSQTGHWLSALTHQEPPWLDARQGLAPGERGDREITPQAMAEYYGSLV
jgi:uncharacterized phage-associated protein